MRSRWTLLLLALATVPGGGCSSTRLAYDNAGWLLTRELGKALCLETAQRTRLRAVADSLLRWHRKHELPRYAALLRKLEKGLARPLTHELFRSTLEELDQARKRAVHEVEEPLLRFGMSLGSRQAGCLALVVAKRERERLEDERASPEAYAAKQLRQHLERIEPWVGALNRSQRELLARLIPSRDEAVSAGRTRLRKSLRLISALSSKDLGKKRRWLRDWITLPHGLYTEEERRIVELQNRRNQERLWQLLQTLDPSQRRKLGRKLAGYAADFESLTGTSSGSTLIRPTSAYLAGWSTTPSASPTTRTVSCSSSRCC